MFPFLIMPLAFALGIAAHGTSSPAARAAADSAAVANVDRPVTVNFENQAWDLATVYAVPEQGLAVRLGQVTPGTTQRFVLPRTVVSGASSVNIVAVPFARSFASGSGPVTVVPGDVIDARLSSDESAVWVLPGR